MPIFFLPLLLFSKHLFLRFVFLPFLVLASSSSDSAGITGNSIASSTSLSSTSLHRICAHGHFSALLHLKQRFTFSRSPTNLSSWNVDNRDCCSWEGIACDTSTGHVIGLNLSTRFVAGTLDFSSLFRLRSLHRLDLSYSTFDASPIPPGFDQLANLTHLSLRGCTLYGHIPPDISRLTRLVVLDLSRNGYKNASLSLQNQGMTDLFKDLSSLRELYLDDVNMSAEGSQWSQAISDRLPNLQILSMHSCGLLGPIYASFSRVGLLRELDLGENSISSPVPDFIANFTFLTSMTLSGCGLYGEFPKSIFSLPKLQHLSISSNPLLVGFLPEFSSNSTIQELWMWETGFHGKLPDSLGNLKSLTHFFATECNLSGPIPKSILNLTQLFSIDLSYNSFSGLIPSALFSLPSLQQLILHDNHFDGELSWFPNASSSLLGIITLHENSLRGQIPSSLFELTEPTELLLSWNHFSSIGFQNVSSSNLERLELDNNNFQGPIPRMIFQLTKLKLLWLSWNHFSSIGFQNVSSSNLQQLELDNNNFQGPIPSMIFQLTKLESLRLQSNNLNGTVDLGLFHKLERLDYLDLSNNSITAIFDSSSSSISESFPQLVHLDLKSCHISKFPEVLRNQDKLRELDLSSNNVGGNIPQWIWKVGNGSLSYLNLSHNSLEGFEGLFPYLSLTSMRHLDLSFNMLEGTIVVPPPSSYFLSLSNNQFGGELSSLVCGAAFIEVLDLSDNSFVGLLPQCLGGMSALQVLNIRGNAFHGPLLQTFNDGCRLESLDLSDNQLAGQVPRSLVNCQKLTVLNLGNNQIEDTFPSWLENLLNLRVLVLRTNKFHGPISLSSTSQAYFSRLQIIDLSSNYFNGSLPSNLFSSWRVMKDGGSASGFLNMSTSGGIYYQDKVILVSKGTRLEFVKILIAFTVVDFSQNQFHGDIPSSIAELKSLRVLNMSHNHFVGEIPVLLENLRNLESLDLAENKLSGNIPWELTKLSFLEVLNLSQNQLTGKIPQSGQFLTFENASFMGNPGLCGDPLSKKCGGDAFSAPPRQKHDRSELDSTWIGFGVGYGVGLGIFFWVLVLWRKGREAFFVFTDRMLLLSSCFTTFSDVKRRKQKKVQLLRMKK